MKAPWTWAAGMVWPCKGQVPGGAGVVDDGARKAVVEGGPGGGVDAHVAHGPADDYFFHSGFVSASMRSVSRKALG